MAFDPYPWFAIGSSVAILVFFSAYAEMTIKAYRRGRTDVSAGLVMASVTFVIMSIGLILSSGHALTGDDDYLVVGLSLTRGAALLCGLTLVLLDHHRRRS